MTALPTRKPSCPPAQRLEAHFAGESSPDVVTHLPSCDDCRAYLSELADERVAFTVRYPTEALLAKHAKPEAVSRKWWGFALGFAAATALALGLVWRARAVDDVHLKGGAFSVLVVSKDGALRVVAPEERLRPGDSLRFRYVVPSDGQLAILDRDERGASVLVPSGSATPMPVRAGAPDLLPGSITLDDALGPEWIVAVFAPRSFELAPLLEDLRRRPPSERPTLGCAECELELVRVEKVK